jgi:hypothetical protein
MKQALRNKWQELQKEDIVTAKKNWFRVKGYKNE